MSVDYKTGSIRRSAPQIAEAVQWVENNAPVIPARTAILSILKWLEKEEMVTLKALPGLHHRSTQITICNWETYQNKDDGLASQEIHRNRLVQQLEQVQSKGEIEISPPPVKEKLEKLCAEYPEVTRILKEHWLAHIPLPSSSQSPTAKFRIADTLRLLHTADGYTWEVVGQLVEYAATVWQPQGMIGSPASLRDWTKKHDRKVHEAILTQLNGSVKKKDREPDFVDQIINKKVSHGLQ